MTAILRTNAVFTGVLPGADWLSSFFWEPGTIGGSNTDASDCLARFRAFWNAMSNTMVTGVTVTFDTTVLAYQDSSGDLVGAFTASPVASVASGGTGDVLPMQTQGLIRWNTSAIVQNRRVRGRTFVPAPSESQNTSAGDPAGTYVSGLAAGVAALMTAGSTGSTPQIWHRPVNQAGGLACPVTGGSPSTTWSVLRSRRG